jgi:hypothetical protein
MGCHTGSTVFETVGARAVAGALIARVFVVAVSIVRTYAAVEVSTARVHAVVVASSGAVEALDMGLDYSMG